jgi:hypothetical protein
MERERNSNARDGQVLGVSHGISAQQGLASRLMPEQGQGHHGLWQERLQCKPPPHSSSN